MCILFLPTEYGLFLIIRDEICTSEFVEIESDFCHNNKKKGYLYYILSRENANGDLSARAPNSYHSPLLGNLVQQISGLV